MRPVWCTGAAVRLPPADDGGRILQDAERCILYRGQSRAASDYRRGTAAAPTVGHVAGDVFSVC